MVRWIVQPDWSDSDTTAVLLDALVAAFWEMSDLKEIWQTIGMSPGDVEWSGTARSLWSALTRDAAEQQKLEPLVREVRRRRPAVADRLDQVLAATLPDSTWYFCGNRYRARLVGPGFQRAVMDRSALAAALRSLSREDYPVLAIRGEPGSGKSHSRHLIQHVAADPGVAATLLVVDVEDEWPGDHDIDVVDFVARLAQRLGMPADFKPDIYTEGHRTAKELSSDFVGRFSVLAKAYRWIFIDGLDRPHVTSAVHGFVRNLAKEVETGQLGRTRLIVTGHPGDFPQSVEDVLIVERIEQIEKWHVEQFFAEIAGHIGTELDGAMLGQLVKAVLAEASLADLRTLGKYASRIAHHHFAGVRPA